MMTFLTCIQAKSLIVLLSRHHTQEMNGLGESQEISDEENQFDGETTSLFGLCISDY